MPKVPQPSSRSSRMQTQDQSCPYNLSTVGESARKSLGLGFQGEAAIRIWFLLAKHLHVCPRPFSLHCPVYMSTQAPLVFLLTTRQLLWDREMGRYGAGRQQVLRRCCDCHKAWVRSGLRGLSSVSCAFLPQEHMALSTG